VGDIIKDPGGGVWIHVERISSKEAHAAKLHTVTMLALALRRGNLPGFCNNGLEPVEVVENPIVG
jgi:hypothetical protein